MAAKISGNSPKAQQVNPNTPKKEVEDSSYSKLSPASLDGKGKILIDYDDKLKTTNRVETLRRLNLIEDVRSVVFSDKVNPALKNTFDRKDLKIYSVKSLEQGVKDYLPENNPPTVEESKKDYLVVTKKNKNGEADSTIIFLTPKAFENQTTFAKALISSLHETNLPPHPEKGNKIGAVMPRVPGVENEMDKAIKLDLDKFKPENGLNFYDKQYFNSLSLDQQVKSLEQRTKER